MNPTPNKPKGNPTLAAALKTLKRLQEKHHGVVEASDIKDDDQRAVLLDTGFLKPVMKGWYICSSPSDNDGDTTAWYASFWAFVGRISRIESRVHVGMSGANYRFAAVSGRTVLDYG